MFTRIKSLTINLLKIGYIICRHKKSDQLAATKILMQNTVPLSGFLRNIKTIIPEQ